MPSILIAFLRVIYMVDVELTTTTKVQLVQERHYTRFTFKSLQFSSSNSQSPDITVQQTNNSFIFAASTVPRCSTRFWVPWCAVMSTGRVDLSEPCQWRTMPYVLTFVTCNVLKLMQSSTGCWGSTTYYSHARERFLQVIVKISKYLPTFVLSNGL